MKAILMSSHPVWCEKIFNRTKTIEVRKTKPKLTPPFKVYVYMTATKERFPLWEYVTAYQNSKGNIVDGSQKVIGSFICDWITKIEPHSDVDGCVNQYVHHYPAILGDDCLSFRLMKTYLGNSEGYDWHITEPKLFDTPKELSKFNRPCKKYKKCEDCPYSINEDICFGFESIGCDRRVIRPPQSWCYVEE